jgi:hypothetical protein
MTIDQRNAGAAVTAGSGYTLDRWNVDRVWAGSTVTIQQSATAPTGFSNSLLATVSTGAASASNSYFSIQQYVEGYNIVDLALGTAGAKTFTVSFWVRSSVTGAFGVCIRNSAFNLSYCTTYTISAADTWEYKTVTIAAPTSGTFGTGNSYGINVIFSLGGGADLKPASNDAWVSGSFLSPIGQTDLIATTGATFYLTGVQLEVGDTATPFEHRSYGQELALCQRYYQIAVNATFREYIYNVHRHPIPLRVSMRAAPTISVFHDGSAGPTTGIDTGYATTDSLIVGVSTTATGNAGGANAMVDIVNLDIFAESEL